MKLFVAMLVVAALSVVVAGVIVTLFGQKAGIASLVILFLLARYSRRMGAAMKRHW